MANTQDAINRVCDFRELPRVKKGQKCDVDGRTGVIFGGNHSANFNVKFDDTKQILNCHPYYKMKIFKNDGELLYKSDDV